VRGFHTFASWQWKYSIKGQHFVQFVHLHILHLLRLAQWLWRIGASFWVSPKPSSTYVVSFVAPAYRCCLYDFTGALFCNLGRICGWFPSTFSFYVWHFVFQNDGLLACFCHKLTFNQTGGFDHSVFDTFVQLTEGRSARDQPKQPPAKKNSWKWCRS